METVRSIPQINNKIVKKKIKSINVNRRHKLNKTLRLNNPIPEIKDTEKVKNPEISITE